MIIEDDELRELYKTSSSEHLQKLEAELMQLEKNPQDTKALEEFLREAHTLKGDSRMLGLDEIEMLVHQMEDCLEEIKQGKEIITSQLCDRLYRGIDAVNQLAHTAITGELSQVNTVEVLALLMGAESESNQSANDDLFDNEFSHVSSVFDDDDDDLFDSAPIIPSLEDLSQEEVKSSDRFLESDLVATIPSIREYQIDTIRVEPQKLDVLMTQAGELTVIKLQISQQIADIERILSLWTQWHKDTAKNSSWLAKNSSNLSLEQLQPIQYFFDNTRQKLEYFGTSLDRLKVKANEDLTSLEAISDRLESGIQGIPQLKPDVICTDLQMPEMDGLEFTKQVMAHYPVPILVLSNAVQKSDVDNIYEVMKAGAVDIMAKPQAAGSENSEAVQKELVTKIRVLSTKKVSMKPLK
jgi:two-component system chemotaxis sensor kinase CheA